MFFDSLPVLRYAQAAEFSLTDNGFCHQKTIPFYIFAQAFEGHYEVEADGEFAVCQEGGAFFVPPDTPLKIWHYVNKTSGVMRIRFVHFIIENSRGIDPFFQQKLPLSLPPSACREPAEIIRRLLGVSRQDKFLYASDFMLLLSRLRAFMTPREKSIYPEIMEKLLVWVKQHAAEKITTADLEKKFPFSRSKMFALFRAAAGMSPGDYILNERINYAAGVMLSEPEISVKEVAARCGWSNPYHFSRNFRKITGVSPGKYVKTAMSMY